jgi:hypothetical protein
MVRHFRYLQGKEARQTAKKVVQKRQEEGERERRRGGRAQDQAATDQVG